MKKLFSLTWFGTAVAFGLGAVAANAGTNGFVVPTFRVSPNSESGYWESFTVSAGLPGNQPDMPGATTSAVLTQLEPGALIAGSGNLYNPGGISSFELNDSTPYSMGTVALHIGAAGAELDYSSVLLAYSNSGG